MTRAKLLALWLLCVIVSPVLLLAMFFQALSGSESRALNMAAAYDECGNALFGGPETQTISCRVGNGLLKGDKWASYVAPCIDFFFGQGHCLANANLSKDIEQ